jgi:hypothetical protein
MEFNEKEIIKLLLTEVFPEANNPIEAAEMLKERINNRIHLKLKHGIPQYGEMKLACYLSELIKQNQQKEE